MSEYRFDVSDYPGLKGEWLRMCTIEFDKQYFHEITKNIDKDVKKYEGELSVYPPKNKIFNAFELTPFEDVKCVILGQDPYIRENQAMGLSFSVNKGIAIPPSLLNVFKEMVRDGCLSKLPKHGDLSEWAKQGVLLLNPILTVREGKSNSHASFGWKTFTQEAIKKISKECENVVFMLWGNDAKVYESIIDTKKHHILKAGHPSPLNKTVPFVGCSHFSKTNELLKKSGKTAINWDIIN